ncbi:hypothetical protein H4219_005471 [Mycoemilia scoparia]|uniref:Uncharacterized protein n=1 Tax=Mycoemilia scoparia TaxID=417184 RepID=A0A9W7ZTJ4_9FUNG|nr:hypothetical protein H4219_005471 [Mycoemilia scoparia]
MINPKEFADSMLQIIKQRHANHENAKLQHEATDDCTIHDCFDCKKYFADHHRAQQVKDFFSYTSALLERIKTTLESNRPTDSELLLYSSALSRCSDAHMNMEAIKNAVDTNDGIDHYGGYDGCVAAFLAEFIEFFIHFDGIRSMGRVLENDQIPKL